MEHVAFKPKLDRTLRLRAIRRLQSQKQAEITTAEKRAAALDESLPKAARAAKAASAKLARRQAAAERSEAAAKATGKPLPAKPEKPAPPAKR
jgi:hypothetical protein